MLYASSVATSGLQSSALSGLNYNNPANMLVNRLQPNFFAHWRARPEGGYQVPAVSAGTLSQGTSATNNAGNPSSITITSFASTASDLLLIGVSFRGAITLNTVVFGNFPAIRIAQASAGNNIKAEIWAIHGVIAQTANIVFTFSGATDGVIVGVEPFSGAGTSYSLGTVVTASGTTSNPSLSITVGTGEIAFNVVSLDRATALTVGSGETEQWNASDAGQFDVMGGASTTSSTGAQTLDWTGTGQQNWVQIGIIVQPSPAQAFISLETRWHRRFKAPDDRIIPMPFKQPDPPLGDQDLEDLDESILLLTQALEENAFYEADSAVTEDGAPVENAPYDNQIFDVLIEEDQTDFNESNLFNQDEFVFVEPDIFNQQFDLLIELEQLIDLYEQLTLSEDSINSNVVELVEEDIQTLIDLITGIVDEDQIVTSSVDNIEIEETIDGYTQQNTLEEAVVVVEDQPYEWDYQWSEQETLDIQNAAYDNINAFFDAIVAGTRRIVKTLLGVGRK